MVLQSIGGPHLGEFLQKYKNKKTHNRKQTAVRWSTKNNVETCRLEEMSILEDGRDACGMGLIPMEFRNGCYSDVYVYALARVYTAFWTFNVVKILNRDVIFVPAALAFYFCKNDFLIDCFEREQFVRC